MGDRGRSVWLRLLEKSHHVRVYIAYSEFEAGISMPNCREALESGVRYFRAENRPEERAMLLEHWMKVDEENGDEKSIDAMAKRQAKRVKKRRTIPGEDGQETYEEYMDYVFPDDKPEQQNLKILEMAHAWKQRKTGAAVPAPD